MYSCKVIQKESNQGSKVIAPINLSWQILISKNLIPVLVFVNLLHPLMMMLLFSKNKYVQFFTVSKSCITASDTLRITH